MNLAVISLFSATLVAAGLLTGCTDDLPPDPGGNGGNNGNSQVQRVVFTEGNFGTDWGVVTIAADGTGRLELHPKGVIVSRPGRGTMAVLRSTNSTDIMDRIVVQNLTGSTRTEIQAPAGKSIATQSCVVSPDGSRVAYGVHVVSTIQHTLVVANADGTGNREISELLARETTPAFSPDGQRIAFFGYDKKPTTNIVQRYGRLYVVNADGSNLTIVADNVDHHHDGYSWYDWAPAGDRLVYADDDDDSIIVIGADGNNRRGIAKGIWPVWSPDGKTIAFTGVDFADIWTVNVDGSGVQNLTNTPGQGGIFAQWSPDGKKLLYTSYGGAPDEVPGTLKVLDLTTNTATILSSNAYKGFWVR